MKKITTLLATFILLSTLAFASDGITPSKELQKEFNEVFSQSSDASWEKVADYYKVSFIQNDQYLVAYFDENYSVEIISRNLSTDNLPLFLKKSLNTKMNEASWITDCFELYLDNITEYYVVVETADQKISYRSNDTGWEVYKKTNK
jgi:hypothetical protein